MPSGGSRARSGPAPDPNSYRSQDRDWVFLPAAGWDGAVPEFPFADASTAELSVWAKLWRKPQAQEWSKLDVELQLAAYVRAFVESVEPAASAGLKTAVLRMEAELGVSILGMHSRGWRIDSGTVERRPVEAARQTSSGDWLKAVSVEGA